MKVITTGLLNRFWTKGIKPWLDKRIKSYADLMVTTASGYTPDALAVKEGFTELNGKLTKNNIKKTYNSDTAFNNVINDIASNIADGESANFSFLIDKRDYYFGYLSKYASNIYGGYFVSLGGVNYKFTSAIGVVEV